MCSILQRSDVEGFSQLPLFLCGESLGGCIAVHAIARLVSALLRLALSVPTHPKRMRGLLHDMTCMTQGAKPP